MKQIGKHNTWAHQGSRTLFVRKRSRHALYSSSWKSFKADSQSARGCEGKGVRGSSVGGAGQVEREGGRAAGEATKEGSENA